MGQQAKKYKEVKIIIRRKIFMDGLEEKRKKWHTQ